MTGESQTLVCLSHFADPQRQALIGPDEAIILVVSVYYPDLVLILFDAIFISSQLLLTLDPLKKV